MFDSRNFSVEPYLVRFKGLGVTETKDFVCGKLFKRERKETWKMGTLDD